LPAQERRFLVRFKIDETSVVDLLARLICARARVGGRRI
jgi:hypothetical protein